jgi:hypothetical protein
MVALRYATPDDLPAVVELWKAEAGPTRRKAWRSAGFDCDKTDQRWSLPLR